MSAWAHYCVVLVALYSSACVAPASALSTPTGSNSTGINGTNSSDPVKVPCPEQYAKLCPNESPDKRIECALKVEKQKRWSMSGKCKILAQGLIMNSHRQPLREIMARNFNKPTQCTSLGSAPGGKGVSWWTGSSTRRALSAAEWWVSVSTRDPVEAAKDVDFTLVTQATQARMWMVKHLCERWPGDIIIAVGDSYASHVRLPAACTAPSDAAVAERSEALLGLSGDVGALDPPLDHQAIAKFRSSRATLYERQSDMMPLPSPLSKFPDPRAFRVNQSVTKLLKAIGGVVPSVPTRNETARRRLNGFMRRYSKLSKEGDKHDVGAPSSSARVGTFTARVTANRLSRISGEPLRMEAAELNTPVQTELVRRRTVTLLPFRVKDPLAPFPINELRNHALCRVSTTHAFYNDVDLWPSSTLYRTLHAAKRSNPEQFLDAKHALVVPAFEIFKSPPECLKRLKEGEKRKRYFERNRCTEAAMPRNFSGLQQCSAEGRCQPFDAAGNPEGHASTGFEMWFGKPTPGLRALPCFRSNRFEPYLVLPAAPAVPLYEELFAGYGKNKIQHTVHLLAAGFTFSVVQRGFVLHFPHERSTNRLIWDVRGNASTPSLGDSGAPSQRSVNDQIFRRFLRWCSSTYGGNFEGSSEELNLDAGPFNLAGVSASFEKFSAFASSVPGRPALEPRRRTQICKNTTESLTWTERQKRKRVKEA